MGRHKKNKRGKQQLGGIKTKNKEKKKGRKEKKKKGKKKIKKEEKEKKKEGKVKGDFREEKQDFFLVLHARERKEKGFRFSLRFTEIEWSDLIGLRVKVHLLGEGYTWALKSRSFDVVPNFGFSGSRKFRV